jgi:CBS-domain-containing membrane protein
MHEMLEARLREALVDAAVSQTATFAEASEVLHDSTLPAIAVLKDDHTVVGLFGAKELIRGIFPGYLSELRHRISIPDDLPGMAAHVAEVGVESVTEYMVEPHTVDIDTTSAVNIAEDLLHSDIRAVAVLEDGRYIGVIGALRFCWLVYSSLAPSDGDAPSD